MTTPGASFTALYEAEVGRVFRTVLLVCRDEEIARDATQEAFARALERWERLEDEPWVGGWLTTTALNVAKRSLRRPPGVGYATGEPTEPAGVELWEVVRSLPEKQRTAVVLRYRLGLDTTSIASAMGLREGTVRTHLARATQSLRQRLANEEVDDDIR